MFRELAVVLLIVGFAFAAQPSLIQLIAGGLPANSTISVSVSSTGVCTGDIFNRTWNYTDTKASLQLGEEGDLSLNHNQIYYLNYSVNGTAYTFKMNNGTTIPCQSFMSPVGSLNSTFIGIAMNNSTIARTGTCSAGYVVQNTTTTGVQCVSVSASSGNITGYGTSGQWAFFISNGVIGSQALTTSNVSEGSNLYYTDAKVATVVSSMNSSISGLLSSNTSTNARVDALNASTIGLLSSNTSTNARVDSLNASTIGLLSSNTSTNARINSINASTIGLLSSNTSTNARVDALNASTIGLLSSNTSTNARVDALNASTIGLLSSNTSTNARVDWLNLTKIQNNTDVSLNSGVFTQNSSAKSFQITSSTAKGACSTSERGSFWIDQGGAGVADLLYSCLKNSSDNYNWIQVSTG